MRTGMIPPMANLFKNLRCSLHSSKKRAQAGLRLKKCMTIIAKLKANVLHRISFITSVLHFIFKEKYL